MRSRFRDPNRRVRMRLFALLGGFALATISPSVATADGGTAVLRLDDTSYISFSDTEGAKIPPGSSITFQIGSPAPDGSLPLSVRLEDLSIGPVPLGHGRAIQYRLAEAAWGTLRPVSGAWQIDLFARLVATSPSNPEAPPMVYAVHFTTERTSARSADESEQVDVDGTRLSRTTPVRLVGAATNDTAAFPSPGSAAFAVLSGHFDALPALP